MVQIAVGDDNMGSDPDSAGIDNETRPARARLPGRREQIGLEKSHTIRDPVSCCVARGGCDRVCSYVDPDNALHGADAGR